jgi:GNAT superfamily N-acetyltransferase
MTFQIRKATIQDLPDIYSFEHAYIKEIEPHAEERWKNSIPLMLKQWIDNLSRMFIAHHGIESIEHCFWQIEGKSALLASIYISPLWRRKGYGLLLLNRYEKDAIENGYSHLSIGVHELNPASALYKKAEYRWTHQKDAYNYFEKDIFNPNKNRSTRP